jgi:hypothetical protein
MTCKALSNTLLTQANLPGAVFAHAMSSRQRKTARMSMLLSRLASTPADLARLPRTWLTSDQICRSSPSSGLVSVEATMLAFASKAMVKESLLQRARGAASDAAQEPRANLKLGGVMEFFIHSCRLGGAPPLRLRAARQLAAEFCPRQLQDLWRPGTAETGPCRVVCLVSCTLRVRRGAKLSRS